MNWKWLLSASEPRGRYVLLVVVGMMVMMSVSYPIWAPGGPGLTAIVAMAAVILSHLSAKFIMR